MTAQQVVVALDRAGLVAALPQCSGAAVAVVDVAHVAPAERLHDMAHLARRGRRHQQVHVVGHQHIGVHGAAGAAGDVAQLIEVPQAVDGLEETRLPVVAALDDMLRHVGQVDSQWTGHGRRSLTAHRRPAA